MILVTVGTHFLGFERLVRAADELAKELNERVVIQYGSSKYIPQYAEGFAWTSSEQMERFTQEARVVITHAAAGAIILALKNGKPLVVTPRRKVYNEHIDNHQYQLCEVLNATGRAILVENPSSAAFKIAIERIRMDYPPYRKPIQLESAIKQLLAEWDEAN